MASKYEQQDLSKIRPVSIETRESKVSIADFAVPGGDGKADRAGLASAFPDILKGGELKAVVAALRKARDEKREIVWLIGAHVLKCGLSLYINSLMELGFITALSTTGSATVHDIELAFFGRTSEDVSVELPAGRFGMVRETAEHFDRACALAQTHELGLGEAIGQYIEGEGAPHREYSVFCAADRHTVPATVHVALGTDITHQHPGFSGSVVGDLSMRDFRIHAARVGRVFDSGMVVIFGSAVVLPEVFLKAVSIAYNTGRRPNDVTAASFDMLQQYRVRENVLSRPFHGAGRSFAFSGHHEIMLPLLYELLSGD